MAKFIVTKEVFIGWHDQHTWDKLCAPLYEIGLQDFLKDKQGEKGTIEAFVHYNCIMKFGQLLGLDECRAHLKPLKEKMCKPIKRILVYHSHHDDSYFDASTGEELEKAAYKILSQYLNFCNGYSCLSRWNIDYPTLPENEINKLQDGPVKAALIQEWTNYNKQIKTNKDVDERLEMLEKIKKNKDGRLAYQFLLEIGEKLEIVNISTAKAL